STVSGNLAQGMTVRVAFGRGGRIINSGTLTVLRSTVSGNTATATTSPFPGGTSESQGGGIFNGGAAEVVESTVTGHQTTACGQTRQMSGGGIRSFGPLTLVGSTVTANTGATGGGLLAPAAVLRNVIVAQNSAGLGPDVLSTVDSRGHNLIGDGTRGAG